MKLHSLVVLITLSGIRARPPKKGGFQAVHEEGGGELVPLNDDIASRPFNLTTLISQRLKILYENPLG